MFVQKAKIENGTIEYNILGKIKADELEFGLADANYIHEQISPASQWSVVHNLGKRPSVSVVDSSGRVVFGEINYIDNNTLMIKFKYQFAGKAYCN